jgi:hypothetical protein
VEGDDRAAASQAWMLAASVSRTGTRFVDQVTAGAMIVAGSVWGGGLSSAMSSSGGGEVRPRREGGDGNVVVRSGSLHAARRGVRRGVECGAAWSGGYLNGLITC